MYDVQLKNKLKLKRLYKGDYIVKFLSQRREFIIMGKASQHYAATVNKYTGFSTRIL